MSTVSKTAGAAGTVTLTIKNSAGSLVTPVSTPTVQWYTDALRTTGALTLSTTGSGSTYTASWTGPQAPATPASRYLKVTIEVSTGVFDVDSDDDISFVDAGSIIVATDYTTLAVLKASLGIAIGDVVDDPALSRAITGASRRIDKLTGTTFYPVTATRIFQTSDSGSVWVDRFTSGTPTVATGANGSYTTTLSASDYVLWPYNAVSAGGAYTRIDVPGGSLFTDTRPTVQVTAAWGWHYVPQEVEDACVLMAARGFRRKDTPEGVAGTSEFGVVRISKYDDPDAMNNLSAYMSPGFA